MTLTVRKKKDPDRCALEIYTQHSWSAGMPGGSTTEKLMNTQPRLCSCALKWQSCTGDTGHKTFLALIQHVHSLCIEDYVIKAGLLLSMQFIFVQKKLPFLQKKTGDFFRFRREAQLQNNLPWFLLCAHIQNWWMLMEFTH